MTRPQLIIAFVVVSLLQWLLLGCAAPRITVQIVGERDSVQYVAKAEF